MLSIKLAFRNLMGSGKRTWLNISVLSIAFVVIVFYNGMLDGWNEQAHTDTKAWESGSGRLSHPLFDQFVPFTLADAHAATSSAFGSEIEKGLITPLLITQATAYPNGRLVNVLLKGIDPKQTILKLPVRLLDSAIATGDNSVIPAIIGDRMAKGAKLKIGDQMLVRWRDSNGTFDAKEVKIVGVFKTNVPSVDVSQVWIPLEELRTMIALPDEATYMVLGDEFIRLYSGEQTGKLYKGWKYEDEKALMEEIDNIIAAKRGGSMVISVLLLCIALLAIFDTQVLSIFRRQKEIGTYIALGMTRLKVMTIFTIEGTIHSVLAIALGTVWGLPLLKWIQYNGIPMPKGTDQAGVAIADKIIPLYSAGMILSTVILVVLSSLVVSYLPARKISKMKPTDALRGKML
ncbi:MAG TPA: ABC transporter permease [Rikenellaceae bacterium]|nr:ABC transporter permease [Rikenellaceae bacterium]